MTATTSKQAVTGFNILTFQVKKSKDTEKVKLVLEADIDCIGSGSFDIGDVLKALQHHMTGDTEVGLSLFMQSDEDSSDFDLDDE